MALLQRSYGAREASVAQQHPVVKQFWSVERSPLDDQRTSARRKFTTDRTALYGHLGPIASIPCVEMRLSMFIEPHRDNDAEEPADFGHARTALSHARLNQAKVQPATRKPTGFSLTAVAGAVANSQSHVLPAGFHYGARESPVLEITTIPQGEMAGC
jgi:hypothetical protein